MVPHCVSADPSPQGRRLRSCSSGAPSSPSWSSTDILATPTALPWEHSPQGPQTGVLVDVLSIPGVTPLPLAHGG